MGPLGSFRIRVGPKGIKPIITSWNPQPHMPTTGKGRGHLESRVQSMANDSIMSDVIKLQIQTGHKVWDLLGWQTH